MIRPKRLLFLALFLPVLALVACGAPPSSPGAQRTTAATSVATMVTAAAGSAETSAPEPDTNQQATPEAATIPTQTMTAETATPVEATSTAGAAATAGSTTTAGAFPLTITDGLGRELTFEAAPMRIVSLAPTNTEILFAVGAGDQVVGVTEFCNYPAEATTREKVGGFSATTISVEKIVALKPDLVVSADESHQPVIDALSELNIPVMALKAATFDDVYRNIGLVGQITGHPGEAGAVVAEMRDSVDAVTSKVADIPQSERPTVYWEVYDEPLMTAGPPTFIGQMIELAGGVNLFADVEEEYPTISGEEVVQRNPAVIMGPDSQAQKLTPELLAQRPGWGGVAAIQTGRVALINDDLAVRAGPRLPQALEAIAEALHPDLFR